MTEIQLQAIEKDVATLSLHDHIKLMEVLARQLMVKSRRSEKQYDWNHRPFTDWAKVSGMGKMLRLMLNECERTGHEIEGAPQKNVIRIY